MIQRFKEIIPNKLYRGSAPTPQDVFNLKSKYGINKIISLDERSGEKIDRTCKILGVKQIKIYLDMTRKSIINLLKFDLKKTLLDDGPTYIHCLHGKDRTGLLAAMFKCKYLGESYEDAINEAKSLGFGVGVDPAIVLLYEKIIRSCDSQKDINNADIVSNEREYISDNRSSYLDEGHQGSFAPYISSTRQYPVDNVYNSINDQSPTRENYKEYKSIKEHNDRNVVPMVGVFNNNSGIQGAGPTENIGGFIYE